MKNFLRISISGSKTQTEALLPSLVELGCIGFQETDTHLIGFVELPSPPAEAAKLGGAFRDLLRSVSSNAEIAFEEIADRNWNAEWERTVQPIAVGTRIAIVPSWCDYRNDDGRVVLRIDPKMSFGTGYHGLCLEPARQGGDAGHDHRGQVGQDCTSNNMVQTQTSMLRTGCTRLMPTATPHSVSMMYNSSRDSASAAVSGMKP